MNLKRAVDAMDCEISYVVKPKGAESFAEYIWKQLADDLYGDRQMIGGMPGHKYKKLFELVKRRLKSAKFRRNRKWNERRGLAAGRTCL